MRSDNKTAELLTMVLLLLTLCIEDSGEFRITTNTCDQLEPAIYESKIIWQDKRNGNWDIYGYNLSTKEEFQITADQKNQYSLASMAVL